MFLPNTYAAALILTILTMICWGSWANTQKLTGKWRFELYYFDYALGVAVCAVIAAFTFGAMNSNEVTALDSLSLSSYRNFAYGVLGGVVFNLANMLLVAAITIAGLSVAFPVGIGLALVIGVIWNYILSPQGHPALLFGGAALVVAAIIVDAIAYRTHAADQAANAAAAKANAAAPPPAQTAPLRRPKAKGPVYRKAGPARGILLSLISGVLMGSFYPIVQLGRSSEVGLSAYGASLAFAFGVLGSTFPFSIVFSLLPPTGEPAQLSNYFRGSKRQHLLGLAGGLIWMTGTTANFVASSAPPNVNVGPAVSYAIGQGATMISALWGLIVWKEFEGAASNVKRLLAIMLLLFAAGLTLVSIAPLYGK